MFDDKKETINDVILKVRNNNTYENYKKIETQVENLYRDSHSIVEVTIPIVWEYIDLVIPYTKKRNQDMLFLSRFESFLKDKIDLKNNRQFIICGKIIDIMTDQFNRHETFNIYIYNQTTFNNIVSILNIKDFNNPIEISPTMHIKINNKNYSSIYEIMTNFDNYLDRFYYDYTKNNFYGTTMFYLELDKMNNKHSNMIKTNIYYKNHTYDQIHNFVNRIDPNSLLKLLNETDDIKKIDHEILEDNITPIERAIFLYFTLNNPILIKNLEYIIILLCNFEYKRSPSIYAYIISKLYPNRTVSIINEIKLAKNKYGIVIPPININININKYDIANMANTIMIGQILENNNNICEIVEYIKYINYNNFDYKTLLSDTNILRQLLPKIYNENNNNNICEIILLSEMTDIFMDINNFKDIKLDNHIVDSIVPQLFIEMNFLSLLYLLKKGHDIFEKNNQNLLMHKFVETGVSDYDLDKMLKFIKKYNKKYIEFLNQTDQNNSTFLHKLAINNPKLLCNLNNNKIIGEDEYDKIVSKRNNDGNTIFHILVRNNEISYINQIIELVKRNINVQNNNLETLMIIAAKNIFESMFVLLKNSGGDDKFKDIHGNTAYHYICINNMFIGSEIINTENNYGFKPSQYTFYQNYWKFT